MSDFETIYSERLIEIESYLDFIAGVEKATQGGVPRIGGNDGELITTEQKKIIYSSVYLLLYNLIESTITGCIDEICEAVVVHKATPEALSEKMLGEWVRTVAGTHKDFAYDKRWDNVLKLFDWYSPPKPVSAFSVERGGGGNWDHKAIEKIVDRLGLTWRMSEPTLKDVLVHWKDDMGALSWVKTLRNNLAHGEISFVECAQNVTAQQLRDLTSTIAAYLSEIIELFKKSVEQFEFLNPNSRPARVLP